MEYKPYSHVGNLYFGINRQEVRRMYGEYRAFKYGFPTENRYGDDFGSFHAYYTADSNLEAVSLFPPCSLEFENNKIEVSTDALEVVKQLRNLTEDVKYSAFDQSYYSNNMGIVIFCPDNKIENVLLYDVHYYDEENEYLEKNFGVKKFEL